MNGRHHGNYFEQIPAIRNISFLDISLRKPCVSAMIDTVKKINFSISEARFFREVCTKCFSTVLKYGQLYEKQVEEKN